MIFHRKLNSFHIIENESLGESKINLLRWTYPSIEDYVCDLITSTCFSTFESSIFYCIRSRTLWIYLYQGYSNKKRKAIVVTSREFDPKKYKMLCNILFREYSKQENPVDLVKLYLNVFIKGSCMLQENGAAISYDFDNFKSESGLKELISTFGAEIIYLYNAILLKRRVLIYHQNVERLQQVLYAVINLVPKRNVDDFLEPFVYDVRQLKGRSYFVAGIVNDSLIEYTNLYDILINLVTPEIRMTPRGKEALSITDIHKNLASSIVKLSSDGKNDEEIVNEIEAKTKDIQCVLESFITTTEDGVKIITVNDLKNRKLPPSTENFFFHLGIAEDMMML